MAIIKDSYEHFLSTWVLNRIFRLSSGFEEVWEWPTGKIESSRFLELSYCIKLKCPHTSKGTGNYGYWWVLDWPGFSLIQTTVKHEPEHCLYIKKYEIYSNFNVGSPKQCQEQESVIIILDIIYYVPDQDLFLKDIVYMRYVLSSGLEHRKMSDGMTRKIIVYPDRTLASAYVLCHSFLLMSQFQD